MVTVPIYLRFLLLELALRKTQQSVPSQKLATKFPFFISEKQQDSDHSIVSQNEAYRGNCLCPRWM